MCFSTPLTIATDTPELYGFTVSAINPTADTVSITYQGLPASQPKTYQNFIAIWAASMIPWKASPLRKQFINDDNQDGSLTLTDVAITRTTYIVGYGVGPDITTICACSLLNVGALFAGPPSSVSISVTSITTNSLAVRYQTLAGYLPQQYGNWIGLWGGFASPYNAPDPLAKVLITSSSSEGTATFENVSLSAGCNYTLVYFVGASLTTAAAMLYFSTDS